MQTQGIDVSHYQGIIDWNKVTAQGVAFAYAKASEGAYTDAQFAANYAGIRAAGMLRGAYHYFDPGCAASDQVTHFLAVLGAPQPGDLPPMLDLETMARRNRAPIDRASIVAGALKWLDQVQCAARWTPVLYCTRAFWMTALGSPAALMEFPLWIAEYTGAAAPVLPPDRPGYAFWQYADSGRVDGIAAKVDLDWFNGTPDELRQLGAA